jgi:hypothetical protein
MLLLLPSRDGKLPLATTTVSAPLQGDRDSNPGNSAKNGYRTVDRATQLSEPPGGLQVALRFKQTETKQGLGSADDQRPRPALSGSNRGKSLKQS